MANYGPSSAFLVVAGRDISSATFGLDETTEQMYQDSRGLGKTWQESKPVGVASAALETEPGLYDDDAALGLLAALQDAQGTRKLAAWGVAGHAPGADCAQVDGTFSSTFKRLAQKDGLTMAGGTHTLTGALSRGRVLHGLTAETAASGNTEGAQSVDNLASSANGAHCDLHVPSLVLGGYTSVTLKVRHSADDVSYVDLATFAVVSAGGANERVTVAGTVNRHLAMSWAFNGAGSGQSVEPLVAAARL